MKNRPAKRKTSIITKQPTASLATRREKIAAAHGEHLTAFGTCPDDYETLRDEAVHLGKLSGQAFLLMAQRLRKIRDLRLYEEGGYRSFKAFIESEMTVAKSTAYAYMNVLEAFGEDRLLKEPELEYSKLAPAVPLLKASVAGMPKAKIRKRLIAKAKTSTHREMAAAAKDLAARYGVSFGPEGSSAEAPARRDGADPDDDSLRAGIARFLATIPDGPLSREDKQRIRVLIKELTAVLVRPGA